MLCVLIKELSDPVLKKVSTFKIFHLERANIIISLKVLRREMSDPAIKRVQPTKFLACGWLILCVLMKEMSDPAMK